MTLVFLVFLAVVAWGDDIGVGSGGGCFVYEGSDDDTLSQNLWHKSCSIAPPQRSSHYFTSLLVAAMVILCRHEVQSSITCGGVLVLRSSLQKSP